MQSLRRRAETAQSTALFAWQTRDALELAAHPHQFDRSARAHVDPLPLGGLRARRPCRARRTRLICRRRCSCAPATRSCTHRHLAASLATGILATGVFSAAPPGVCFVTDTSRRIGSRDLRSGCRPLVGHCGGCLQHHLGSDPSRVIRGRAGCGTALPRRAAARCLVSSTSACG